MADRKLPALLPHKPVEQPLPPSDELDALASRSLGLAARGFTPAALARQLRIPLKTLNAWAAQPNGAKLRDALSQVPDLVRGHFENEARKNTNNKNYNTALFGKVTGANFDEYRSVAQPLSPSLPEKPDGMTDFEFERRLKAAVERIVASRGMGEATTERPAITIDHDPGEKTYDQ